jgi:micrococcal nuclease
VVLSDGRRIRYLGINAPEIQHSVKPGEPFGSAAMRFNQNLALHQKIRLERDAERQDAYGRHLAYLFLSNGVCLNTEIVRQGYAYCLPNALNRRYEARLLLAQREAMQQGRGIWKKMKKGSERLVGNIHSKRFHRPGCQAVRNMRKANQLFIYGKWNAFWNGYAPCQQCLP